MQTTMIAALALLIGAATGPANAMTEYEERDLQRRCEQEQRSIDKKRRGTPSCDQLDRMYGIQKPAKIIIQNNDVNSGSSAPTRVYDPNSRRWCWVHPNGGPIQCD
jgi:hypothetical protein